MAPSRWGANLINISFANDSLHDVCVDLERAELRFGTVSAGALTSFIADAESLENAAELIDFYGDEIEISGDDSLIVSIGSQYRATLVVVGKMFKRDKDGRVVWKTATRLKLVDVSRWP